MPRRIPPVLVALALASTSAAAQNTPATQTTASCRANVDSLEHRIELNYAGYLLEVVGERRRQLSDTLARLETVADRTPSSDCVPVLNALIDWYHDPHLFLFQTDVIDTSESARRRSEVTTHAISEADARDYFTRNHDHLDPLEGIWYDLGLRVAIVPSTNAPRGIAQFDAVVLSPDTSTWKPGEVRARFTRRADGTYDALVWNRARILKTLHGVIYKRVMLRLSPGIWGKAFPVAAADAGLLDPVDPHRATLQRRGSTVVISIPSHDPSVRFTLDTLLQRNDSALRRADQLIIDVRGNEGGSAFVTNGLVPFIRTDPSRTSSYDASDAMILSSPNQIAYATRTFAGPNGAEASPALQRLLARMRENPGRLVPLADSLDTPDPAPPAPIYGPRRVAVMTDRGTVSAAEVLVLQALHSTRATVIGQPTEGALDYQSVNIVYFSAIERRWGLGYPTITRSASLPQNGMRGAGMKPDVLVDWSTIADPIAYVDGFLKRQQ